MASAPELLASDEIIEERDGKWVCKPCLAKNKTPNTFTSQRGAGIHKASMHTPRGKALRRRQSQRRREQNLGNGHSNGQSALAAVSIPFPEPVTRITIDSDHLLKGYNAKDKLVTAQILASEKK